MRCHDGRRGQVNRWRESGDRDLGRRDELVGKGPQWEIGLKKRWPIR